MLHIGDDTRSVPTPVWLTPASSFPFLFPLFSIHWHHISYIDTFSNKGEIKADCYVFPRDNLHMLSSPRSGLCYHTFSLYLGPFVCTCKSIYWLAVARLLVESFTRLLVKFSFMPDSYYPDKISWSQHLNLLTLISCYQYNVWWKYTILWNRRLNIKPTNIFHTIITNIWFY